jgi:uncharacterized membrane protein
MEIHSSQLDRVLSAIFCLSVHTLVILAVAARAARTGTTHRRRTTMISLFVLALFGT